MLALFHPQGSQKQHLYSLCREERKSLGRMPRLLVKKSSWGCDQLWKIALTCHFARWKVYIEVHLINFTVTEHKKN